MHCSDPFPTVSIKHKEEKAVLCGEAMENSSFSGQTNSVGPSRTNLALMGRMGALSERSRGNKSISQHQTLLKEKHG